MGARLSRRQPLPQSSGSGASNPYRYPPSDGKLPKHRAIELTSFSLIDPTCKLGGTYIDSNALYVIVLIHTGLGRSVFVAS